MTNRVLIIGLDGFNHDMIARLKAAGCIPNLTSLLESGYSAPLMSTTPPFTMPAWSTLMTGKNPGDHGIISFFERDSQTYHLEPPLLPTVDSQSINTVTVWDILEHEEREHGVINLPVTYPPTEADHRFMISGMMTPSEADDFYTPPDLKEKLGNYVIDYVGGEKSTLFAAKDYLNDSGVTATIRDLLSRDDGNMDKSTFLEALHEMMVTRGELSVELCQEREWEVMMTVFTSPDRLSHYFWPYFTDEGQEYEFRDQIERFYEDMDRQIGEILNVVDLEEDYVMFVSDHGFGHAPTKRIGINNILRKEGYLSTSTEGTDGLKNLRNKLYQLKAIRKLGKAILPQQTTNKIRENMIGNLTERVDWSNSVAYGTPLYSNVCGIEINRKGIKPKGIVTDEEYEQLRDDLIELCSEIIDPQTGECVVSDISKREDIYSGKFTERFPDIVIEFNENYKFGKLFDDTIIGKHSSPKNGDHRSTGIFILAGPSINESEAKTLHDITDIAPTVCHLTGVAVSEGFDGSVIDQCFLEDNEIKYKDYSDIKTANYQYNHSDSGSVKQRLNDLGYIE